ncbi:alpha/beta hydrolase [Aquihabitans sp. G128]|uniref:alpha/beta hydrolase n=1 Tax=Aquihabitans sp. G128 TaxID=2849779 RepID=UPI001C235350|nr:alpha/beta hydrolase [Aquihabitans sp. G128]QXC59802.1 alpha/beta hydrolase [Aquihabitans sp. G128]
MVISTTGDPATPYESGVKVAKQIPGAVLITNVGEGHTIFAQGKACVDDAVTTYLVDLTPPKAGLKCE